MTDTATGANPAPGFAEHPDYRVALAPCAKRLRATFGGATLFDTARAWTMCESGHVALYYVPRDDADMGLLAKTASSSWCPFKGHASHYTICAGGREARDAAWSYESPFDECAAIAGHLAFYWDRLDRWFEEDEEVFVHARDPFVRIDILASSRKVEVIAGGERVAASENALFLFETGLPVRYYLPPEDVRTGLLAPSDRRTACPYKGTARYRHLSLGGTTVEDAVWCYPEPLDEVRRIRGRLCFHPEKVDAIAIDGRASGG